MKTIKLGRTDLEVSRICLGTWQFGGDWGEIDRGRGAGHRCDGRASSGINLFDTAQGVRLRRLGETASGERSRACPA